MFGDKITWVKPAIGIPAVAGADEGGNEFAHLEMEMSKVTPAARADGGYALPAPHLVSSFHKKTIAVRVVGLHVSARAVLLERMQHDNHVAPAWPTFAGKKNGARSHSIDWVAEIGVLAADTI